MEELALLGVIVYAGLMYHAIVFVIMSVIAKGIMYVIRVKRNRSI